MSQTMPIAVGALRDQVTIQSRTLVGNSFNEQIPTWTSLGTVFANVQEVSGRETWFAGQAQADVSHKVTLRYFAALGPKCRLLWGSKVLQVSSVINPDGRKRYMEALCVREVSN